MGEKNPSGKYLKFITYLIVVVLVNVAGLTLFFRADLTANKVYSISQVSREVVSTLSEPLTINVFFTKDLPAPYNTTERYLHDLLEEYGIYANHHFNYRFYDVSPDEGDLYREARENRELAKNYGIHPVQIQAVENDQVKFQKAYMGLVLIHGDTIERIPTVTSTEGLEYRLTTAIQKLNNKVSALLNLQDKIRVKLFLSSSLNAVAPLIELQGLSDLPKRLEEIIGRLNDKNYGKLEFEYLDPTKDEGVEAAAAEYNVLNLKWPALEEGKIPPGKGMAGVVLEYGQKVVEIPVIRVLRLPLIGTRYEMANLDEMEEVINDNLESLIDINENLGYLSDKGTINLWDGSPYGPMAGGQDEQIGNFRTLASQNYTLKPVNIGAGPLIDSFNCLVIARPTEEFTDYDLYQIDQFLMKGKSLAIFLDAFKEEAPANNPMAPGQGGGFVPLSTGLEKLLGHYGVRVKSSFVLDENCYRQELPAQFGGGEQPIYFAPMIKNEHIRHDTEFMKNIKGLVAFKISPLELLTDRISTNGLTAHELFSSSEKSWEMSRNINLNPMYIQPPGSGEGRRSLPLAYLIEGEFPSYFAGKPIPERPEEKASEASTEEDEGKEGKEEKASPEKGSPELAKIEGEGHFISKGKPGKIFLMASSAMIQDNVLDEQGKTPNATFIMNVLDDLNHRGGIAVMRSKQQSFNPLADTGAGIKTFVKTFNIAGLPVVVVLFGILVWYGRHARKKRIQMMFQKQG